MLGLESLGLWGLFLGTFLAATVVPFSSDALYIAILALTKDPVSCLVVGTLGNWLGGLTSYGLGYLGKWEWLERYFKVKPETLEKQKRYVDRYGVWLGLFSWVPIVGDVFAVALGFYKASPVWCSVTMLVGKFARFALWTLFFI